MRAANDTTASPSARTPEIEAPKTIVASTPYRAKLPTRGAELYLPPWFTPRHGGYDLIVHFHGLGKLQEANIARAQLDVCVVSLNLGVGTDPYSNAFRDPEAFTKLLAEVQDEIDASGRGQGAKLNRLALSAWSAGFVSVGQIMRDEKMAARVDAVLLADGFFTSFTDVKKRTMNVQPLEKFVTLANEAEHDQKLFALTHTTIPTGDYPSTQEVIGKLIELTSLEKTPSTRTVTIGPREMHEIYRVDRGAFHVEGFEGVTAKDHIQQIRAMGETLYPYLKARWDKDDRAPGTPSSPAAAPKQ